MECFNSGYCEHCFNINWCFCSDAHCKYIGWDVTMTEKQYRMFDIGSPYLTYCGVKSNDDYFENMTECCEELNRLFDENDHLKQQVECHKERIQILSELLDLADMIIDLSDDEKAKESWGNKNRSFELKWKEVLKKYGKGDV